MKIALLSCGRSDYSIYLPLLKKLKADNYFDLHIVALGTHPSSFHGHTLDFFKHDDFTVKHVVESLVLGDSQEAISSAMGLTIIKLSSLWAKYKYDLIICLGDRYEMFAAVASSVPFNIPIAHIHGGETTLGAIDNAFRHSITAMSTYHFASTAHHAKRIAEIVGNTKNIHNVGAMAIDNIKEIKLLSPEQFNKKYTIDLRKPSVLVTFHPETVAPEKNKHHVSELIKALTLIPQQLIITMPNADSMGNLIRSELLHFIEKTDRAICVENFGTLGYYSCIKYVDFLIGNSSSGIIEAASFNKYVINIGDRQKGRDCGKNILHCPIDKKSILTLANKIPKEAPLDGKNIYGNGNTAQKIIAILKSI